MSHVCSTDIVVDCWVHSELKEMLNFGEKLVPKMCVYAIYIFKVTNFLNTPPWIF